MKKGLEKSWEIYVYAICHKFVNFELIYVIS